MVAKINVTANVNTYVWAKAYCIECALDNQTWTGSLTLKDIYIESISVNLYIACQVDMMTVILKINGSTD